MRPKIRCLTIAAVFLVSHRTAAQPSAAPSLLPPPGTAAIAPPLNFDEPLPVPDTSGAGFQIDIEPNVVRVDENPAWRPDDHWLVFEPWDTGVELGINGSSGTSESLSIRTGWYVKRESRFSKLHLKGSYNHSTESGNATQNNAQFDVRNDWLLDDESPWTLYGTGEVFYDEFQAFDLQSSANSGIGYRFIHEPEVDLIGRFGAGASREFGGPDDRWVPESLLGFEYNQKLSQTQTFYGKLDYYPEWEEVGEFRLVADCGWQIQFAQPSNLSLKISASDRYDSTPNGVEPHLVNYSVLLLLKL
jgi:putative salt-induced outer membrane protein YdiY